MSEKELEMAYRQLDKAETLICKHEDEISRLTAELAECRKECEMLKK